MKKPRIRIEVVERKGPFPCHRGHVAGDVFDFDSDRGSLCPMAMHTLFPYIDIVNQFENPIVFKQWALPTGTRKRAIDYAAGLTPPIGGARHTPRI